MKFKQKYHLLLDYISKNILVYFIGLMSVIICNIFQVYFATAMGHVIEFFSNEDFNPKFFTFWTDYKQYSREEIFYIIFFSILISKIILTISRYGWRISLARQTHLVSGILKNHIWDKARFFKYADFSSKYSKGILMNAANSDVGQARFLFGFILVGIIDTFFLGLFTVICMFQINFQLSIVSILFLLFIPIIVRKLSNQEAHDYDVAQNALSDFNDLATKSIDTVKLQKLGQTALFWFKRLQDSASFYMEKRLTSHYTSLKFIPFMGISSIVSYIVLFSYGIYLNIEGVITVGEFVSMQGLVFILQDPMMELGFIISEWRKASTSLARLNEIYVHEKESYLEHDSDETISESSSFIYDLKNISFSYDQTNKIFDSLNLQIKHGDKIGITGRIGTGKSTLVDLLSGLQRAHEGELLFNGKKFSSYSHKYLRSSIVCVHQKPFLFADTIKKNISMDVELSDEKLWYYLRLAGLEKDIQSFEKGLDTYLGEWGINLSGGQKQRLTLCRALAKGPEILLLDDGLSAVDTVTEELILSNLNSALKDTTIVWVAHRRSTLKYCTRIIDLDII